MGTSISQKIDAYAQANLKALKQEEAKTGKHLTKYDIAERMVKSKKLTSGELNSWLKTSEGNKECSLSAAQKNALKNTSAWVVAGFGGINNDENTHYTARLENASKKAPKNPVEKQNAISGYHIKLNETVAERRKRNAELNEQIKNQKLMNHKKTAEEQKFKAHIDSVKLSAVDANKTASQLTKEIEQQNVEMLSHDDRKKFIMDKFQDAAAKKDFSGMKNALSEFNSYMCKHIDDEVGVTATKDAIKKYSGLNALVDYVDNLVDDGDETNLSKLETAWNITKGLGDAVDGFLGAEGLEMVGALGAASKAASVANVGKYFAVATQSYFGVEGGQLIGAGLAHAQTAETEEDARLAGSEIGMGSIMLGGAAKSVKTGIKNAKIAEIKGAVEEIRADYSKSFEQIKSDLKAMGLDDIGNMSIRLKGEQSLYDKISNYMKEHKGASLEDAIKDVRDAIGARTVVKSGDFKSNPEVKALLEAGREQEAILKAAEIQSKPAVDALKAEILKQEQNGNKFTIARISNYVAKNGIPYFSENQLAELKQFAINHGVKLKINLRINESDPNFSKVDANYKPTTKSQPSGYTALQANFTTKEGKIIEWQFRGDRVNEFAEGEHVPYDLRTGKDIIGKHKELEPLYNPIKKLLSEKNMSKDTYKEYNRYLGDYYNHLRKLELGFESVEPRLEDYGKGFKFDKRLKAKNLITLHETAEIIKNKPENAKSAIQSYNNKIDNN